MSIASPRLASSDYLNLTAIVVIVPNSELVRQDAEIDFREFRGKTSSTSSSDIKNAQKCVQPVAAALAFVAAFFRE